MILFLFEECMAGDVNLFVDDCQQDTAEIEVMIAGTCTRPFLVIWSFFNNFPRISIFPKKNWTSVHCLRQTFSVTSLLDNYNTHMPDFIDQNKNFILLTTRNHIFSWILFLVQSCFFFWLQLTRSRILTLQTALPLFITIYIFLIIMLLYAT